jgi:L-seryl-tRNA(Ser) seleniumtransferase
MASIQDVLRRIPAVEVLLQDDRLQPLAVELPRKIVLDCVRAAVEQTRSDLLTLLRTEQQGATGILPVPGESTGKMPVAPTSGTGKMPVIPEEPNDASIRETILARAVAALRAATAPHYCRVINATGIILHTALGRAPLPRPAVRQIHEELCGYSLLQADPATGQRDMRDARIQHLFRQLTSAEAATVVNNNAAATWLALNTVAAGREVIVSRGQLVEIGGSFRLPDVMAASGAKLVEVGTTNKTHARDYLRAITPNTAAILRVHPSNYKITGFTSEVALGELVELAHAHGLTLIDDVGAGALVDLSRFGLDVGPTLAGSVEAGADLILSSTDKLIGASQGGVILGKAALVEAVRKNPLARIVRVGKLTLAALEATLGLFFDEAWALAEVPTLRMVCRPVSDLAAQAERIAEAIGRRVPAASVELCDGVSQMGGGSLPGQDLPTRLVTLAVPGVGPDELATRLRRHRPAVFARIGKDRVIFDPRTVLDGEEAMLVNAVAEVVVSG